MRQVQIKNVKRDDFFRLANSETSPLWIRGEYDKSSKKYECCKYDNVNRFSEFSGKRLVFVD